MPNAVPIAIVSVAVRLPGAGADLDRFWADVASGRDCSREVPAGRWVLPPHSITKSGGPHPDHVPTARAYFLDPFEPDLDGLAIDAAFVNELDPLFQLVLDVGNRAARGARLDGLERRRAGIIFGNICLPTDSSDALARQYLGPKLGLGKTAPVNPLNRHAAGLPAGLLARALQFGGTAFTLDAACASTLYALKLAADELASGRADFMLAGGASRPDSLYTQMGFAQLRALSPRGRCTPFDNSADGLMVGEGAGLFGLKRLIDAIAHGDTIHGVIAGAGLSNDMSGNLLAPATEGQLRAMRAAYDSANWQPQDVDLIECHATGTPVGDGVELASLHELWNGQGTPGQCVIGSVKATVGHLLTAAGTAALAKVLLALKHGVKPPQANLLTPAAGLTATSPFRLLGTATPWAPRGHRISRKAALSGFGFGGVNAHLLLEEYIPPIAVIEKVDPLLAKLKKLGAQAEETLKPEPIAIVGLAVHSGAWSSAREFQEFILGGGTAVAPKPRKSGWNLSETSGPPGYFMESLNVPLDRFRIPPRELEEMLPQQVLMLQTAAAAMDDSGAPDNGPDPRSGVFIGLGLDLNTTNYHLRWATLESNQGFPSRSGPRPPSGERGAIPPLNADRVMGSLGSIAASRIARAFQFGGPGFTCCSEDTSAGRALELAIRALRNGEIDRALVGGVELAGDPRTALANEAIAPHARDGMPLALGTFANGASPADGAAAFVLKRLSDAEAANDRIYAVIAGVGSAVGGTTADITPDAATLASSFVRACSDADIAPGAVQHWESAASGNPAVDASEAAMLAALFGTQQRTAPMSVSASRAMTGHAGFASAGIGLAHAALCVYNQILPPAPDVGEVRVELAGVVDYPPAPRYWLMDAADGPRTAAIAAASVDGTAFHAILREHVPNRATFTRQHAQPLGARAEGLFAIEGDDTAELLDGIARLEKWLPVSIANIEASARDWARRVPLDPTRRLAITAVARTRAELAEQLDSARTALTTRPEWAIPDTTLLSSRTSLKDRLFFNPFPIGRGGKIAFVFPGSGNHFAGMGRDLALQWPAVLRRQQSENRTLRSQFAPHRFWCEELPPKTTAKEFLFGQVALGTLTADLLVALGVKPEAMLGFSLGESAGLFGLRVWRDRDDMLRRINESTLFGPDLGPPFHSARTFLGLRPLEQFDWISGVVAATPDDVRAHLRPGLHAYLLIVSHPNECVIGGAKGDVEKLAAALNRPFLKLLGVTLAHCEFGRPVSEAYRELHTLPVTAPPKLKVYSGAWGKTYSLTEQNCADSITAGLLNTLDLPLVVETAYRDNVRAFIEVGPGGSASRAIDAILGDRPHIARSVCVPRQDNASLVLRTLARLIAERYPITLNKLYGEPTDVAAHQPVKEPGRTITIPAGQELKSEVHDAAIEIVPRAQSVSVAIVESPMIVESVTTQEPTTLESRSIDEGTTPYQFHFDIAPYVAAAAELQSAAAAAHARFLAVQDGLAATAMQALAHQQQLLQRALRQPRSKPAAPPTQPPRSLTLAQCRQFAVGKIGDVLGPMFAAVDSHPTRVRLPDGPLMLVDRVLTIEGEAKSMTRGRVVTDHTVHSDRWYLDSGRCPTSVTVEAGQADLFLSAFLGIDFHTKGHAVYRLLDAVVTFHRGLPRVGERVEYDIYIDEFFRQGESWLFRFRFEGTIDGAPMLSMKNGVAGFFTQAALDAGQGIIHTKLDLQPAPGKVVGFAALVPQSHCSVSAEQVEALRHGDYVAAFGKDFAFVNVSFTTPMTLPGGMLRLVDRVPLIDPAGGRFGLGFIRAEYDIRPQEWFIECHFVDDKVMPGTLMYECCLHTLRILLHRFGWVGAAGTVCEPVPGVASRLKCRGQVLETTRTVTYEVSVKEIGYGPDAYAIADALMYADGKPIVEIGNLSLRMLGITANSEPNTEHGTLNTRVYDTTSIQAFSNGNPSDAFGEPYRVFDHDRVIARLPGSPYQFLDRVIDVTGEPFVLKQGAACVAEYAVPAEAWYFAANRSPHMPFSVLLEIALQPCGWLAAYCGSALTSPTDLSFRNLGGTATQFRDVTAHTGTLTMRVTMTKVSSSAGMIIQNYDMLVSDAVGVVYQGTTYFGFFAKEALKNQVGMPAAQVPFLSAEQMHLAESGRLPHDAPFPDTMLRMVDIIDGYLPHGGRAGLGLIQGRIAVDPEFWFFKAHFYQDPVWPGSLGVESFLQLLKYVAWKKFGEPGLGGWQTVALNRQHEWTYRGQVVPSDDTVTVVLEITAEDRERKSLTAAGYLTVDGRVIYQMKEFTLEAA